MARIVKREPGSRRGRAENGEIGGSSNPSGVEGVTDRRVLRSRYLTFKNRINEERDDLSKVDSNKFNSIIDEFESLHQLVQNPREQVADAEALLDIMNTLVVSVRAHSNEGLTPSDFVTCLLRDFGQPGGASTSTNEGMNSVCWKDIGLAVSHIFSRGPGCCTMLGPMNTEIKQRKAAVHRKRVRPTESAQPEEIDGIVTEEKTDTDKNMATMFDILRKNRRARLENLVLNRNSFAQTVENLFALSFLAKDGRAEISVDGKGCHFVSPRNAPAANAVASGEVSYMHFVFRFDYRDWKIMMSSVGAGDELMPHREEINMSINPPQPDRDSGENQSTQPTTPIRKLSRNRGLVLQEQTVVEDSPENEYPAAKGAAIRKGKRKLG